LFSYETEVFKIIHFLYDADFNEAFSTGSASLINYKIMNNWVHIYTKCRILWRKTRSVVWSVQWVARDAFHYFCAASRSDVSFQ